MQTAPRENKNRLSHGKAFGKETRMEQHTEKSYKLYSSLSELETSKTWAEIDLEALRSNYRTVSNMVRSRKKDTKIIAAVKAEAYGHGAPECVRTLLDEGCDFFAVSCIDEATAVREICDREQKNASILILGYTSPDLAPYLSRYNVIQTLLSEDYAHRLSLAAEAAGVTVRTHLAIDTGMNRIGFVAHSEEEIQSTAAAIARVHGFSCLSIEGMFTHYACADEDPFGKGDAETTLQAERYRALCQRLEEREIRIPFHHSCNSAATVRRPQDYQNGVRVGILLFGARPSDSVEIPLSPVMKLKTVISHLHKLLPGECVSYGGTYRAETERLIATVPIGYADGFLRAYSGAFVTVDTSLGACRAPIVGRVCMDQCMIDVTDTGAKVGDVVTLFGNSPDELSAYAAGADTIGYECLCLISSRVTRRYINDRKEPTCH